MIFKATGKQFASKNGHMIQEKNPASFWVKDDTVQLSFREYYITHTERIRMSLAFTVFHNSFSITISFLSMKEC